MNQAPPGRNGLVIAVSMFSVLPVPVRLGGDPGAPLDRGQAGRTLRWLPLVGGVLGTLAGLLSVAVLWRSQGASLLAATVGILGLVVLSGALHLDGLADTADGLGSRAPRERALQIMRHSDIGPFGVAAIVLIVLLDVAASTTICASDWHWRVLAALAIAAATGRLSATHAGLSGVPGAHGSGFGALVTGSVSRLSAVTGTVLVLASGGVLAHFTGASPLGWVLTQVAALGLAVLVRQAITRHLGGMTGDVFGALIELTTMLTLVGLSLSR